MSRLIIMLIAFEWDRVAQQCSVHLFLKIVGRIPPQSHNIDVNFLSYKKWQKIKNNGRGHPEYQFFSDEYKTLYYGIPLHSLLTVFWHPPPIEVFFLILFPPVDIVQIYH